ncbi:MAG: glycoside hydrolase family 1 protein [Candidatus Daviesbacteria bacterium]|nr:glycoside hydrolase family 1 protein [Candidatus Daviesbacteria bacterium]
MADIKPPPKHDHTPLIFPENFLWGSATSAYQVEGNNINADWWDWESRDKLPKSGEACDQYNRYEEDFKLIKDLNQNAHRLSIEWSRIEPEEGVFDQQEIEHYLKELKALKSLKIAVMLTLHHFTLPLWLAKKGGWTSRKSALYFERFVKKIVPELKEYADFWITINEPMVLVYGSYIIAKWPPQKKSTIKSIKATWNLMRAHKKAYKAIHKIIPEAKVGIAQNVQSFTAFHKHSLREQLGVIFSDLTTNHLFYFFTQGHHDFLGINYYFHNRLKIEKGFFPTISNVQEFTKEVSDLGWEIFPEGMFDVLTDLKDGLPIYITECGIATSNDDRRIRFVMQYLQEVYRAIQAGVKVKGFFYWSLLDNFEWADGYDPKFGLIEVDFKTQKRTVRPSAQIYADIAKNNGIRHELMKFLGHRIHVTDVIEIPK